MYNVCDSWLSSVGSWVSEGSMCPSPLPELVERELIFMGHILFPPINRNSIVILFRKILLQVETINSTFGVYNKPSFE